MNRLRRFWQSEQEYEPLHHTDATPPQDEQEHEDEDTDKTPPFSYVEYSIFLLLGVSMLWAWNMFLAAGPYFQHRFRGNQGILDNFQATETSVSTITGLGVMIVLTRLQANAKYSKRIVASLFINMVVFTLLALSTAVFLDVSAEVYFAFIMVMMLASSCSTGLCQNGIFAYVSGFGQPTYMQAIMTGQAVAGVLPCVAQIVSVLSMRADEGLPDQGGDEDGVPEPAPVRSNAALAYFLTATSIAVVTFFAFSYLHTRQRSRRIRLGTTTHDTPPPDEEGEKKEVPFRVLFRKLSWLCCAVFTTFAITMAFPVFTQLILSVRPPDSQPPLLQPPSFIPLAFLFWNTGDFLGRLLTALPSLSLVSRPRLVFALAASRIIFIPLLYLCNIRGAGAVVESDFFYLVVVQLLFGLSNGFLGSTCMMGAGEWVEPEEREVAGGFMGLCLVAGLCVGSLGSFLIS